MDLGFFRKRPILVAVVLVLAIGTGYFGYRFSVHLFGLNQQVKQRFSGRLWELPARIYARPLELYLGMPLDPERLVQELALMAYRPVLRLNGPGSYVRSQNRFQLITRAFEFEDQPEPSRRIQVRLNAGEVAAIRDMAGGQPMDLVRLDPAVIGSFYPTHKEDRILVRMADVSPLLLQTIMAVEDRAFYRHHGIALKGIARAIWTNLRNQQAMQGGSTLTQQLAKNFFLTHERSLRRKLNEVCIALLLEWHYDKDTIFEAYLNEVYLGQDGDRAIHGFGLASSFYFGRPLETLRPHEIALLVGMLKGPSYYDPRRHPQRAAARRNLVLTVMEQQKLIRPGEAQKARQADLGVIENTGGSGTRFPAYLELVKRQLLRDYREADLHTEGLRVFTSFDPQVQFTAEAAARSQLERIETRRELPEGKLETGMVVCSTSGNEVLALVGGRDPRYQGFNRALDARRPIGSLIKPAIYLTALQQPEQYTLISQLDDSYLSVKASKQWVPRNYDRQYHGQVPLYQALAHSYNVATVRLGLALGLDAVGKTLKKLGYTRRFKPYPSSLLGTTEMSCLEVAQCYQTLAAGGFYSPVKAIRSVYTPEGTPLQRYPLQVRQNFDTGAVYLLNKALQTVVAEGTARRLSYILPPDLGVAGKTGTTDGLKDSWFAGFTGDRLAVVWVGRDDNRSTGLTGASGALQVWGRMMSEIAHKPLVLPKPEAIRWVVVNPRTGLKTETHCPEAMSVPFIAGSAPQGFVSCRPREPVPPAPDRPEEAEKKGFFRWLKEAL